MHKNANSTTGMMGMFKGRPVPIITPELRKILEQITHSIDDDGNTIQVSNSFLLARRLYQLADSSDKRVSLSAIMLIFDRIDGRVKEQITDDPSEAVSSDEAQNQITRMIENNPHTRRWIKQALDGISETRASEVAERISNTNKGDNQ